jgi:type IV secretory pathway VirB4 component
LHETQKIADQAKTMKKQLVKLEDIIEDLQNKNKELNELLNKKMIERAENYKQQVVDFLNKPKPYEVDAS